MHKVGFKIFDALEPSQGMLDVAKEKGLYRNYICEAIGKEQLNLPAGIFGRAMICIVTLLYRTWLE